MKNLIILLIFFMFPISKAISVDLDDSVFKRIGKSIKKMINDYYGKVNILLDKKTSDGQVYYYTGITLKDCFLSDTVFVHSDIDSILQTRHTAREYLLNLPLVARSYTTVNIEMLSFNGYNVYQNEEDGSIFALANIKAKVHYVDLDDKRHENIKNIYFYFRYYKDIGVAKISSIMHRSDKYDKSVKYKKLFSSIDALKEHGKKEEKENPGDKRIKDYERKQKEKKMEEEGREKHFIPPYVEAAVRKKNKSVIKMIRKTSHISGMDFNCGLKSFQLLGDKHTTDVTAGVGAGVNIFIRRHHISFAYYGSNVYSIYTDTSKSGIKLSGQHLMYGFDLVNKYKYKVFASAGVFNYTVYGSTIPLNDLPLNKNYAPMGGVSFERNICTKYRPNNIKSLNRELFLKVGIGGFVSSYSNNNYSYSLQLYGAVAYCKFKQK